MNKIYFYITLVLFTSCYSQKPPKVEMKIDNFSSDTLFFWKVDNLVAENDMKPLSEIKKRYKIVGGKLFDVAKKETVSTAKIVLIIDEGKGEDVEIRNGLPINSYCDWTDGVNCKKDIHYNQNGDIDGYFDTYNYSTTFKKGNGYWKDNYSLFENGKRKTVLKEEGEVKNNFKFGKWKYYNKQGALVRIKIHKVKDSIDVRFPHCIFNKNEPCY